MGSNSTSSTPLFTTITRKITEAGNALSTTIRERAHIFYDPVISLFSTITQKITEAGMALFAAIRSIKVELFKESQEICQNSMTWLLGVIFTLKITDTGKAFFVANYSVMMAMVLLKFLSFLTTLFGTLSQMHTRNLFPLIAMLLLESGVSLLALSMISRPVLWIALILWLCIFVVVGYYCYPEPKNDPANPDTDFESRLGTPSLNNSHG